MQEFFLAVAYLVAANSIDIKTGVLQFWSFKSFGK